MRIRKEDMNPDRIVVVVSRKEEEDADKESS